jgi:hypothetical protein
MADSIKQINIQLNAYKPVYIGSGEVARWNQKILIRRLKKIGKSLDYVARYFEKNRIPINNKILKKFYNTQFCID